MTSQPRIEKFLFLSTAHIPADELATINKLAKTNADPRGVAYNGMFFEDFEYGYTVIVYYPDAGEAAEQYDANLTPEMRRVIEFGRQHGAYLIRFDRDEDPIDALPVYEH